MSLPAIFNSLRIPLIGAPLFIISNPDLVLAQCKAGIIGSFPALNAREEDGEPVELDQWLTFITDELDRYNQANPDNPAAPFAVNQIAHKSNIRLERDMEICVKHKVPILITSLGAREEVNQAAHSYGGIVLHDVINNRFAKKAIQKGADGLIAVAAGAGGHAGAQSPFALVHDIRSWFDGPLFLSGAIAKGDAVLSAMAMGANGGYAGSVFIATKEANAVERYKTMVVECSADDIVYSNNFTGVWGNYLKPSVAASGLDPDNLPVSDVSKMSFGSGRAKSKRWKDIWGAGQGIGAVDEVVSTAALVDRLANEFEEAKKRLTRQLR